MASRPPRRAHHASRRAHPQRRGLLVNAARPGTLRLSPPLTVCGAEVDETLSILKEVLGEWSEAEVRMERHEDEPRTEGRY